jgi:HAD superfamily hydrolase (TIGR01490 family)
MKKFAVFDIDGTLIRWQLYHAVTDYLAGIGVLSAESMKEVKEARMRWKRRETEDSFHDYETKLIHLYESSITNISPSDLDKAAVEVSKKYKTQVYVYTRNLIKHLKSQGYFLIAISGSHDEIVAHVAESYGFDYAVGSKFERVGDKFTGKKFIASKNKDILLHEIIDRYNLSNKDSYAVGDTVNDSTILAMVETPIAFNPNKELLEIAKQKHWKIVVERKNVYYELSPDPSGKYHLD